MDDIRSLNEAFDRMFEEITTDETFTESFDEEYAAFATEIDEDDNMMQKMYSAGNVSPADALSSLGYDEADEYTMKSESNVNGTQYTKVFKFDDDFTYTYYVLQDGKIPSGWTATKSMFDDDRVALGECLQECINSLNEAEMSDEDKADSALIKSMIDKIEARSNAAFTPEEKAIMSKYGITRDNWQKKLKVGDRSLNPSMDGRTGYSWSDNGRHETSNGTPSKINYADRARKLPQRADSQISGADDTYFYQNRNVNAHTKKVPFVNLQKTERDIEGNRMQKPVQAMKGALRDRKYAQKRIDNADAVRDAAINKAKAAYDKAVADAERGYVYDTDSVAKTRDYHQKEIDKLLKRDSVQEAFIPTPWKDKAYSIVSELSSDGKTKMIMNFIKWMSDDEVGEFLHQEGYVEYED